MLDSLKKSGPYSVMMDESNDKTNKSCIILIKILDHEVGDVRTKFLDMPIVNISNARNLFDALKSSLSNKGLDFDKCMAFTGPKARVYKGSLQIVNL